MYVLPVFLVLDWMTVVTNIHKEKQLWPKQRLNALASSIKVFLEDARAQLPPGSFQQQRKVRGEDDSEKKEEGGRTKCRDLHFHSHQHQNATRHGQNTHSCEEAEAELKQKINF